MLSPTTGLLLLFLPFLDPLPFLLGFFHYLFLPRHSVVFTTYVCVVIQLCPTLGKPMTYSLPGSSVYGILQARMLEWVVVPSPGDLPDPGIESGSSALQANFSPSEPLGKAFTIYINNLLGTSL